MAMVRMCDGYSDVALPKARKVPRVKKVHCECLRHISITFCRAKSVEGIRRSFHQDCAGMHSKHILWQGAASGAAFINWCSFGVRLASFIQHRFAIIGASFSCDYPEAVPAQQKLHLGRSILYNVEHLQMTCKKPMKEIETDA